MSGAIEWGKLLDGAKSVPSFNPLPDGDYLVEISKSEVAPTSKGEVMFKYQAVVQAGPHAKRVLFGNIVIPAPTAEKHAQRAAFLLRDLKALGFADEYIATQPQPQDLSNALVGRQFTAAVTTREYQGRTSNNINRIKPASAAGMVAGVSPAPVPAGAPTGYAPAPAAVAPAPAPAPAPAVAPAQPSIPLPPSPFE